MGRYISNINTNSYQDNELLLLKQGFAKNRKEFLSAGTNTWTIDHDVIARVRVWGGGGGGGGGGGAGATASPGLGGGAGGAAEAILRLNAGTYNITVGDGGAGGAYSSNDPGGPGKGGGSSSFHTYITCTGGNGGSGGRSGLHRGVGGSATFRLSDFGGFLYVDSRPGGAGGSLVIEFHAKAGSATGDAPYCVYRRSERGEGESGGCASYAVPDSSLNYTILHGGSGGGGYNPPFIYGPGRGVGTGGDGGSAYGYSGAYGQPGAVVIEWN